MFAFIQNFFKSPRERLDEKLGVEPIHIYKYQYEHERSDTGILAPMCKKVSDQEFYLAQEKIHRQFTPTCKKCIREMKKLRKREKDVGISEAEIT